MGLSFFVWAYLAKENDTLSLRLSVRIDDELVEMSDAEFEAWK